MSSVVRQNEFSSLRGAKAPQRPDVLACEPGRAPRLRETAAAHKFSLALSRNSARTKFIAVASPPHALRPPFLEREGVRQARSPSKRFGVDEAMGVS